MKRLYNEYDACPLFDNNEASQIKQINDIINITINKIWNEIIVPNDICPRDAQLFCSSIVSTIFSEKILLNAIKKKSSKSTNHKSKS